MQTRLTSYVLLAVLVASVMLVPGRGVAQPGDEPLAHLPVQGRVSPAGGFVGDLTIVAFTVGDAGQLLLKGVLSGTATHRTGTRTQVREQTFTAPATLIDAGRTTDVVLLEIEPITLNSPRVQIRLAQITLDVDELPSEGDGLMPLLNELPPA
jgi:hypothetical protein